MHKAETKPFIPYGRQQIDDQDVQAVLKALQSDWLTTGPMVERFENEIAGWVGATHGVAVANGTAALHAAMYAAGIGPGDEVVLTPITFAATANAVVFQGGTPVFADVDPDTLLLDPIQVERKITSKTKAIITVDYAGQPSAYDELKELAERHGLLFIADACHALGAEYKGKRIGSLADLTVFSFHPVKHITTGEGGMIVTNENEFCHKMKRFRNHGFTADHAQRAQKETWQYQMVDLGFNYRITDFQCALGISQLERLPQFLEKRRKIAQRYEKAFGLNDFIRPLHTVPENFHAYHLYVIRLAFKKLQIEKAVFYKSLRDKGIGVNVHYIPVYLHPYYQNVFGTRPGLCPIAESAYEEILSLPIYPAMNEEDVSRVVDAIHEAITEMSPKYCLTN